MKIPHFAGRIFPTPEDHEWVSLANPQAHPARHRQPSIEDIHRNCEDR
jgi:hypothetical protein